MTNAAEALPVENVSTESGSPEEQAIRLLEGLSTVPAPAPDDSEEEPEEVKPDPEEEEKKAAAEARKKASAELSKVQAQHAALARRTKAIEAREHEVESKLQSVSKISSISEMVGFIATQSGKSPTEIWQQVADEIRGQGNRTPTDEVKRELDELKKERAAERTAKEREKTEREQAAAAREEAETQASWQKVMAQKAAEDPDRWPTISTRSPRLVGAAALQVVSQYFEKTGTVPAQDDVLDWLESEEAALAPAAPAAAKSKGSAAGKAKTITNADVTTNPIDLRSLSPAEREELAIRQLEQLQRGG